MKIAIVATFDPRSQLAWSGCSHYLVKALQKHPDVELEFVGPLVPKASALFGIKRRCYHLLGKNYLPTIDPLVLKDFARQVSAALAGSDADCILSLTAMPIAFLESDKPIIYFWDCNFHGNLEYPWFANLAKESIRFGHLMERQALSNCRHALYSSEWAARTAVDVYGADKARIGIAPLGANLDCDRSRDDIARLVGARSREICQLLFLGVDWRRKGGDIAFEVAKELNERGLETTLTVVGCQPEVRGHLPSFVKPLGFINKFEGENHRVIERLLASSHFLIMPSIAESFGAVFCEASSFGTPSLARKVGGIPTAVRDGANGKLFSRFAPASEYCDYVLDMFRDYGRYESLALSSFSEFEARLNWGSTAEIIVDLVRQIQLSTPR